jgi:hypothetical protein
MAEPHDPHGAHGTQGRGRDDPPEPAPSTHPVSEHERRGLGVPQGPRLTNPPPPARRQPEEPPPAAPPPPPRRRPSRRAIALAAGSILTLLVLITGYLWLPNLPLPALPSPTSNGPTPSPTPFAWLPQLTVSQVTGPLVAAGYSCGNQPQAGVPGLRATGCTRQAGAVSCRVLIRAQDERHVWEVAAMTTNPNGQPAPDPESALGCDQTAVQLALQHDPGRVNQVMGFVRPHVQDQRASAQIGSLNVLLQHDQTGFTCDLTAGYR